MFRLSLKVLDGGIYQHACNQHDDTSSLRLLIKAGHRGSRKHKLQRLEKSTSLYSHIKLPSSVNQWSISFYGT